MSKQLSLHRMEMSNPDVLAVWQSQSHSFWRIPTTSLRRGTAGLHGTAATTGEWWGGSNFHILSFLFFGVTLSKWSRAHLNTWVFHHVFFGAVGCSPVPTGGKWKSVHLWMTCHPQWWQEFERGGGYTMVYPNPKWFLGTATSSHQR